MKLETIIIKNFRGYKGGTRIDLEDMTAFIGKNDIGKSTILEALEIFFNNETVKIESMDACVYCDDKEVTIGCIFSDLPDNVVIDTRAETTLRDEYFLNSESKLELVKKFNCGLKTPKEAIWAIAYHPSVQNMNDLLLLKNQELKDRLNELGINRNGVDLRSNVSIRRAIWNSSPDLQLAKCEIPLEKEDAKKIWDKLKNEMPIYALFKADRASKDDDSEVQDPMKIAVAEAIREIENDLSRIKEIVKSKSTDVAQKTLEKLKEMDPDLANELSPIFKAEPKWDSIFKLSLTGDNQIPINKRGSGIRRLILLNFFRAEVERKQRLNNSPGVIYAIEEPETSQHPKTQKMLIEALLNLSAQDKCSIIITTHVPGLAAFLPLESLRCVEKDANGNVCIVSNDDEIYDRIAKEIGVFADHRVKVFICVEGPNDVQFLKHISKILNKTNEAFPDLSSDHRIAFIPLGGGTLNQWVQNHYLKEIKRPEIHIYDRDTETPPKYQNACDKVNGRGDNSLAILTEKREIENYLHASAIKAALGINVQFSDTDNVPEIVAKAIHENSSSETAWNDLIEERRYGKIKRAKRRLNDEVASKMTYEFLCESDPNKNIETWLTEIAKRLS